jgi:Flp pilus assembly protein TadG
MRRWRRRWGDESGSAVIETAMAMFVIVPMVFWIFEMCMMTYTYSVLGDAARMGVRFAAVHGTDSTTCSGPSTGCDSTAANVVSEVKNAAAYSFHNTSAMTVSVTYPDSSSAPGSRVAVSVVYTYVPFVNYAGLTHTSTLSAEGRIVY